MRKKVFLLIVSAVITLFFLTVSVCQLWQAYVGPLWENGVTNNNTLIAGWTSLILGLLSLYSLLLICRTDHNHL